LRNLLFVISNETEIIYLKESYLRTHVHSVSDKSAVAESACFQRKHRHVGVTSGWCAAITSEL